MLFARILGVRISTGRCFHSSAVAASLPKVVVTRRLLPESQARLEKLSGIDLIQWNQDTSMPREKLLNDVQGADALVCMLSDKIDRSVFEAAGPKLKLVTTMSVGFDHIDVDAARSNKIQVGYTPNVLTDATADLTVLLTLAAARNAKQGIRAVKEGEWKDWRAAWLCGYQFTGKTLGVVGMGRIGHAVAHRLRAFGIRRIVYWGRREKPELKQSLDAEFVGFSELLKASDFVVACCSLAPETRELFNDVAFDQMKPNAIFVNTGRGGVVQQDALARALKEGKIAGAGLDVTTPEPLPLDDALQTLDNCTVLPHIGSATFETREKMGDMCIDNVLAVLAGEPMPYALTL